MGIDFRRPKYVTGFRWGEALIWTANGGSGGGGIPTLISGIPPLTLSDALAKALESLVQYGKCVQASTPTPDTPQDIVCNNGALRMVDDELPNGYKRLNGIRLQDARIVVPFYITGEDTLRFRAQGASGNWIGSFNDASADDNVSFYASTNSGAKYARYNGQTGGSSIYTNTWYDIVISPTGVTGTRNPSSFTPATFTCSEPLNIGATSIEGTPGPNVSFEGNIVVDGRLTLIPCERESDNALGYYDGTAFYTSEIGAMTSLGYDTSHLVPYVAGITKTIVPLKTYDMYSEEGEMVEGEIPGSDINYDAIKAGLVCRVTIDNVDYLAGISISNNVFSITRTGSPYIDIVGNLSRRDWADVTIIKPEYPAGDVSVSLKITVYDTDSTEVITLGTQTASAEDLLAVGDYKDEQEIITGSVTKRVGVEIFDGTENWTKSQTYVGSFYADNLLPGIVTPGGTIGTLVVCSHFSSNVGVLSTYAAGDIWVSPLSGQVNAWHTDTDLSLTDWKAWLADQYAAGTPVIVIYPLAESVPESVTPQSLSTVEGDNTLTVTAEVDDISLDVTYVKHK